jgi:uncharacterized protein YndB with AHSA1/START domain
MDNIWAIIAIGLVLIVAALLVYASTRPDTFAMSRSTTINAPPDKIFPLIDSLRGFNQWNPFLAPDPAAKLDYFGPEHGVGAGHRWSGNREVGAGSVEITESTPTSNIVMKLHMLKPMEALNRVEFTLRPKGNGTAVTWTMQGRQPFIGKVMTLFIDCDKMVGKQFDKGLASLKALAER